MTNFQNPLDSTIGQKIIHDLIPAISLLRKHYSFPLPLSYEEEPVMSSNISSCDQKFDAISFKYFSLLSFSINHSIIL